MRILLIHITGPGVDPGIAPPPAFTNADERKVDFFDVFGNRYEQAAWSVNVTDFEALIRALEADGLNAILSRERSGWRMYVGQPPVVAIG